MSWFARSLVDALRGEDDNEEDDSRSASASAVPTSPSETAAGSGLEEERDGVGGEPGTPSRGVQDDLSELTKTLTRRLWGVASFLAPPPASTEEEEGNDTSSPDPSGRGSQPEDLDVSTTELNDAAEAATADESSRLAGIRSDFAEISGKVKSGISMLSQAKAVAEISKFASSLLPFGSEDEGDDEEEVNVKLFELDAVGVTEDVVIFASSIAMHPETWLGFPLLREDGDSDEFEMSDAQQKHAIAIERFAPELADLRIELCPRHMSESNFWKIYFVLLHSRLSAQDAELLSTSQVLETRTMLLQDIRIPKGPGSESSEREGIHMNHDEIVVSNERNLEPPSDSLDKSAQSVPCSLTIPHPLPGTDVETEKHAVESSDLEIVDKSVIEEEPVKHDKAKNLPHEAYRIPIEQDEEDGDAWLDDDTGEDDNTRTTVIALGQEENVSFSDLEDDYADADVKASS